LSIQKGVSEWTIIFLITELDEKVESLPTESSSIGIVGSGKNLCLFVLLSCAHFNGTLSFVIDLSLHLNVSVK